MPNPKRRHTRSRRDKRRASNWKLRPPSLSACSQCGHSILSHRICPYCGFYGGKLVMPVKEKKKQTEGQG